MSKRRAVILALKALAGSALPNAKVRGFDGDTSRPERVPAEGVVIGYPSDPGEPIAIDLSPACYHYEHRITIEMAPGAGADQAAVLDDMLLAFGNALLLTPTLGGLCDHVEPTSASEDDDSLPGTEGQRWVSFDVVASYATTSPLG